MNLKLVCLWRLALGFALEVSACCLQAAEYDYDPGPELEKITAPLLAINFTDDLINPPELGILEREIKRVRRGRALVMPMNERTRGHGTHTLAAVWRDHLAGLLKESELVAR